jgi:UDP-arabinose 4-epimerase
LPGIVTFIRKPFSMPRTVLVTGGAGYIGSHACKALAQAGCVPVAYDNLDRGHREMVKWGPFEKGDIGDKKRLSQVISKHKPTATIHFAAYAYVGESVREPAKYCRNNVCGTLALLETMLENGIQRIVFSSSCAVYGVPAAVPITEESPRAPISPYGRTKVIVEDILNDFSMAYGIRFVSLRYFNASGADPEGEAGERHDPETHLIPIVLEAAARRREFVQIHGDTYETPDGTCIRDYIHVSDLARAHLLALNSLEHGGGNLECNLGNGNGLSVKQVIDIAKRVTGREIPVRIGPRRPGDPPVLVADSSRAIKELGWVAAYPEVATHVEHAWKWMTEHGR